MSVSPGGVPGAPPAAAHPVGKLVLLAGAALVVLAVALWPGLPPVDQDEYLPLLPMSWLTKTSAARSSALDWYSTRLFGHWVPVRSYPYVGAVKAFLYAATFLPTSVDVYRAAKLFLVWILFGLLSLSAFRLSRGRAVASLCCLSLLLSDVSLIALGIMDAGTEFMSLLFGSALLLLLYSTAEAPRWWKLLPIAFVVFLGEWDRVNFVWFIGSALAGSAAALLAGSLGVAMRALLVSAAGCALGLYGVVRLVPDYVNQARLGIERSIPLTDLPRLWRHWLVLFERFDPFGAYHCYVSMATPPHAGLYVAYRWGFSIFYLLVAGACAALGLLRLWRRREMAGPPLFLGGYLASLLGVILKTNDAWASHHILLVKPYAYLAFGVLLGGVLSAPRWRLAGAGLWGLLGLASLAINLQSYVDLQHAPPILGYYDVSWNAVDAWQAAARSAVRAVYALDWGVFYPGVVNSPPEQRWEMLEVPTLQMLRQLPPAARGQDVGLLFKASGPHRWLLDGTVLNRDYVVRTAQRFRRSKGEEWVFLVVNTARWAKLLPPGATPAPTGPSILRNGAFLEGPASWRYEKWEKVPGAAQFTTEPCAEPGTVCARLTHRAEADSRIVQEIDLEPGVVYEVAAMGRAEGVGRDAKGVHLCLMEASGVESEELTGDSGWRPLHFYVVNLDPAARQATLAARLGTFGSLNTGTAWFRDLVVRPVGGPQPDVPVYEIGRGLGSPVGGRPRVEGAQRLLVDLVPGT